MLKHGFFLLLTLLSCNAFSQDVIYMNDGSIIKGNITEISNDGDVDIELSDGEVFTLKEYNIKKITYEKQVSKKKVSKEDRIAAYKNKLKVDESLRSGSGYSSFSSSSNDQPNSLTLSSTGNKQAQHNVSIGSFAKTYLDSNSDGLSYAGLGIAYQYNLDKNKALYASYGFGSLKAIIIDGKSYENDEYMGADEDMTQVQIAGLLSTNNYKGWQFFTGLGYFSENRTGSSRDFTSSYDVSYSGLNLHFGLAYSWETFVLRYRMTFENSSDYPDDATAATGNLHLSWNL